VKRLAELDAKFVRVLDPLRMEFLDSPPGAQGVMFDCPHPGHDHSLLVWFSNPIGGGEAAGPEWRPSPRWRRAGETIDTLTLDPSANADTDPRSGPEHRCWHGWVRNGAATP
jgi:hypothetical protein